MKPLVATSGMKEGSSNEEQVLKYLPEFLNREHLAFTSCIDCLGDRNEESY